MGCLPSHSGLKYTNPDRETKSRYQGWNFLHIPSVEVMSTPAQHRATLADLCTVVGKQCWPMVLQQLMYYSWQLQLSQTWKINKQPVKLSLPMTFRLLACPCSVCFVCFLCYRQATTAPDETLLSFFSCGTLPLFAANAVHAKSSPYAEFVPVLFSLKKPLPAFRSE